MNSVKSMGVSYHSVLARRLDPRLKLLHLLVAGVIFFTKQSYSSMLLYILSIAVIMLYSGMIKKSLTYIASAMVMWGFHWYFIHTETNMLTGSLNTILFIAMRFLPFVMLGSLIVRTVEVTEFIAALNKMKVPRVIVLPFAVTVRFIPTIGMELSIIKESMAVRNIAITPISLILHPLRTFELLLVPLMFRCSRLAEELAASALTRAIDYPCQKTSLIEIKLRPLDYIYLLYIVLTGLGVILWI